MKVATVLFTYNRSWHTQQVLNALKGNTVLPEKLLVFHDGLKKEEHREEWEKTQSLIEEIDWCDCEIISSDMNKGLAKSVVTGLNFVFKTYDAAIVLEDDCVSHPLLMQYMVSALEYYCDTKKVYSIGGFAWPIEVEENGTDVYATQRASSWGWATWKDRWKFFKQDYKIIGRIKKNPDLCSKLHVWGEDLENYLLGNVYGYCDSWLTFWALNIIENNGYCITPYKSLIDNIGFDGTGVHCGNNKVETIMQEEKQKEFVFDDELLISTATEEKFANHLSWTPRAQIDAYYYSLLLKWMNLRNRGKFVIDYLKERNINKTYIWGKGKVCDLLLHEMKEKVEVVAIVESKPNTDQYANIKVINPFGIENTNQHIIVIPEYDIDRIASRLKYYGCNAKLIGLSTMIEELTDEGN